MSIVSSVDLRHLFGHVRDQGARPTCLAFAVSDLHASLRGAWSPLSPEYAYFHAQRRAGRLATQGSTLDSMLSALQDDGQPFEHDWPYQIRLTGVAALPQPPDITPLFRRTSALAKPAIDTIVDELQAGRPSLVLMQLSSSFYWLGAGGLVDVIGGEKPDPSQRHAVVAVGHGKCGAERAVLVRNSWGSAWGMNGHGWLTEAFLQPRVFALAFLEDDTDVSPRSAAA